MSAPVNSPTILLVKNFLLFILVVVIVAYGIYAIPSLHAKVATLLTYNECDIPIQYRLGSFDSKFGLSTDQVMQDIGQATSLWSNAEGKTLFTYAPNAQLTVNFVYDQREALNSTINQLNSQLSQSNQSLNQQIVTYNTQVAAFKQELAAYNALVEQYNRQQSITPQEYADLQKQKQELIAEGDVLNAMARQLNLVTNNYNENVYTYNNDINQFQNELAQKPEEGLYNPNNNTITIYLINNHDELVHTLAHEFGHALGMGHVADPHAIMYPYSTSSLTVTPDDMGELQTVCRNQSSLVHYLQQADMWLFNEFQSLMQSITK